MVREIATFAGGCFWCIAAVFKELDGVEHVTSGYAGGHVENPTYQEVSRGETGHAEAVQITYNPELVSYRELLDVFFTVHDPTTKDRQGPDVGSQYRSIIFYHTDEQRDQAESCIEDLEKEHVFDDSIVTAIEPVDAFYEAEEPHQDYYEKHPDAAYCVVNIQPKIKNVRERFAEKLH